MSTSLRTLTAAALVAAGVLSAAPASHAGDDQGHLKPSRQLNAASAQTISNRVELPSRGADRTSGARHRIEETVEATGGHPERVEELQRMKEAEGAGGPRATERAFGGKDGDCGPGVRTPSGAGSLGEPASSCGGEDADGTSNTHGASAGRPRARRGPAGMSRPRRGGPDPRSFIGDGRSNQEHSGAWIGSGRSSSAKGRTGIKDFGAGHAQQSGSSSGRIDEYGTVTRSRREDTDGDGTADTLTVEREYRDGSRLTYEQTSNGEHSWQVDNSGHDCNADMCFSQADRDADRLTDELTGSGGGDEGGEASQPNPNGTRGGGAGSDCLELGIRCGIAKKQTAYERMREAAEDHGREHDALTPQEAFEQAGQPVPVSGRRSAAARVDDGSGKAGFTPGCEATPGGCGGSPVTSAAPAAAPTGVGRSGKAGFTPTCGGGFRPCNGGDGARVTSRR